VRRGEGRRFARGGHLTLRAVTECATRGDDPGRTGRHIPESINPGVLVIGVAPARGKTVVALHRVAYLPTTQRERMERHGVLVVGRTRRS